MDVTIRLCRREDWRAFAACDYAMWRDIGMTPEQFKPDWAEIVRQFLEQATATEQFAGYVAVADGSVIGSAGGQRLTCLSPQIFLPSSRQLGYLWGVYVAPEYRGHGIARQLTAAVIDHLQRLGCTEVRLHASPAGRSVYEKMGFQASREMRLTLPPLQENSRTDVRNGHGMEP